MNGHSYWNHPIQVHFYSMAQLIFLLVMARLVKKIVLFSQRKSMHALPIRLFVFVLCYCFHNAAFSAACCTSAASFGTGRLLAWELAAVGLKTSAAKEFDYSSSLLRTESWGLFGITPRVSSFTSIPWVLPVQHENAIEVTNGLGDVQSGVRYQAIQIGEYLKLPAIAFIGTVTFPTGTPWVGQTPSTGRGIWALGIGTSLEKTWMPWFIQLNIGTTLPLSNRDFSYGTGVQTSLVGGRELPHDIVLSGILDWTFEAPMKKLDGTRARASGYRTNAGVSLAYRFHPNLTLQASLSADLPFWKLSDVLPTYTTALIGLRYGIF